MQKISCSTILEVDELEILLVTFVVFFISMLILVAIQFMRNDVLPTGCTPDGCRRCRKKCPTKAALEEAARDGAA